LAAIEAEAEAADFEEISAHVKCTRLFAQIASRTVKFHSSLRKESRFTARNVIPSIRSSNK
jgi:hypothetical protein